MSHYLMRLLRVGKEWSWRCSCKEAEGTVKDKAAAHAAFADHLKELEEASDRPAAS